MIPAAFDYVRAESADEALSLITQHGDEAKFLAGGHSLLPLMKLRLAQPSVLVDVGRLRDLAGISDGGDHVSIGALDPAPRRRALRPAAGRRCRSSPTRPGRSATRRSATAGRSAARSRTPTRPPTCPRSCSPSAAPSSPARHEASGRSRRRTSSPGSSSRRSSPTSCSPRSGCRRCPGAGWSFQKFNRRAQDWAIVGVAAVRSNGSSGVGLVNMGSTPILATAVTDALAGGASASDAAEHAADDAEPQADLNASVEYRTHLAKVLVRRALEEAGA